VETHGVGYGYFVSCDADQSHYMSVVVNGINTLQLPVITVFDRSGSSKLRQLPEQELVLLQTFLGDSCEIESVFDYRWVRAQFRYGVVCTGSADQRLLSEVAHDLRLEGTLPLPATKTKYRPVLNPNRGKSDFRYSYASEAEIEETVAYVMSEVVMENIGQGRQFVPGFLAISEQEKIDQTQECLQVTGFTNLRHGIAACTENWTQ
jgi:hypothetical protein